MRKWKGKLILMNVTNYSDVDNMYSLNEPPLSVFATAEVNGRGKEVT